MVVVLEIGMNRNTKLKFLKFGVNGGNKMMETTERVNKRLDLLVNLALFQIPLLWLDSFGMVYIFSAIALMFALYPENDVVVMDKENNKKKDLLFLILGILFVILCDLASIYGITILKVEFKGIVFIPSLLLLFYYIIPIVWGMGNKAYLNTYFRVNKRVVVVIVAIVGIYSINAGIRVYLTYKEMGLYQYSELIQLIYQFVFNAALGEELLFRGFFYNIIKKITKNVYLSMVLSSLAFVLMHVNVLQPLIIDFSVQILLNVCSIFLLGIVGCIIYEKSKSLLPSIAFHACYDGTMTYLIYLIVEMI